MNQRLLHQFQQFLHVYPTSSSQFLTCRAAAFSTSVGLKQNNQQTTQQQQQQPQDVAKVLNMEWHLGNRVARLIIDDKRVNTLSFALMNLLHNTLRELDAQPKVRAVIIAATGPAFSAGHCLEELTAEAGTESHHNVFNKCLELLTFIRQMQVPVIAEVDGMVAAAGTQLVASCDIVIASGRASFNVGGIKLGLFCATPAVPLSRCLPQKIACDMLLTGRYIDGPIAHKFGLVSRLTGSAEIRRETLSVAQQICDNSRAVTAMGKAFFYAQQELNMNDAYRQAKETMCDNLKWRDAQEGISAFIKRPKGQPQWTHTDEKVIKD